MTLWIVLNSLFVPPVTSPDGVIDGALREEDPMRYRGIEQLLAKFEAEDDP